MTDCRNWPGYCADDGTGHGQRWDLVEKRVRGAHVMAWEEANGRHVAPGEVVRHSCDNPPCIEPTHLLVGSQKDNVDDCIARGRARYATKLSAQDVEDIVRRYLEGEPSEVIAGDYGIHQTHVPRLVRRLHPGVTRARHGGDRRSADARR